MEQIEAYFGMLAMAAMVGVLFRKSPIPLPLILVIVGMLMSLIPQFPEISLSADIVLNIFLPILIYEISAESTWRDIKLNLRPIMLMSVGHVVFITIIVALVIHTILPEMGWPLAFVLGAVISPPDDAAIMPIMEKVHMPQRIVTILKSEAMLNDATALIIFQFALTAALTHRFSETVALESFFIIILLETLYGITLGYLLGILRLKLKDPTLQMMISMITPFLAYLPAQRLGGCGVLAVAVTGLVIGHRFFDNFAPEVRLIARSFWTTLSFAIQSILFLLVGLNLKFILDRISAIPSNKLCLYSGIILLVVIVGRFVWTYTAAYLPRWMFPSIRKRDPYPPWQHPFIISWAGMRGAISLAAALAVPTLPFTIYGANTKDFLLFLVFCVIIATLLIQGISLPWIMKVLGVNEHTQHEKHQEHIAEISAKITMTTAVLKWLHDYKDKVKEDDALEEEIKFHIQEYTLLKKQLQEHIKKHGDGKIIEEITEFKSAMFLADQIIEVERNQLIQLWREEKISSALKNKLRQRLDHRANK